MNKFHKKRKEVINQTQSMTDWIKTFMDVTVININLPSKEKIIVDTSMSTSVCVCSILHCASVHVSV